MFFTVTSTHAAYPAPLFKTLTVNNQHGRMSSQEFAPIWNRNLFLALKMPKNIVNRFITMHFSSGHPVLHCMYRMTTIHKSAVGLIIAFCW